MINHTDVASAVFGFFITGSIGNGIMIALLATIRPVHRCDQGIDLWPSSWPLIVRVVIGLVISDLVMYPDSGTCTSMTPCSAYVTSITASVTCVRCGTSAAPVRGGRTRRNSPIPLVLLGAPAIAATLVGAIRVTVGLVDRSSMPLRTGWLDYVIHANDHWVAPQP